MMIFLIHLFLFFESFAVSNFTAVEVNKMYAPEADIQKVTANIKFWEDKIASNDQSTFQLQLAASHFQKFQLTGAIQSLSKAEYIYKKQLEAYLSNRAAVQRALAQVYISQHRFCEALDLVVDAADSGSDLRASELLLFDIYMELNQEDAALDLLEKFKSNKDFHVLIRMAKWEDSQGRLAEAIKLMEAAKVKAEQSRQIGLMSWIYTNLADFYGHDGQIDLSAAYFMKALKLRPSDWYAAKGLAWIIYADQDQPDAGLAVLNEIRKFNETPDFLLKSAEMLSANGDHVNARKLETTFLKNVLKAEYRGMYDRPAAILLGEQGKIKKALKIAKEEVAARPDPSSYALLAYIHYLAGEKEIAKQISREHVIGKTFEPEPIFYQLFLFQDDQKVYEALFESVKDARFELGPMLFDQLNHLKIS